MKCPVCKVDLQCTNVSGSVMGVCTRCAGIWLDNETSAKAAQAALPEAALQVVRRLDVEQGDSSPVSYREACGQSSTTDDRRCPVCETPLTRTRVKVARLDVDVCPRHGTWFDRCEIWRLDQAIRIKQHFDEAELEDFESRMDFERVRHWPPLFQIIHYIARAVKRD